MNKIRLPYMSTRLLFLVAVLAMPLFCYAQTDDALYLDLDNTVAMAKEQSPSAKAAKYAYLSVQYRYRSFVADLRPRVSFNNTGTQYFRSINAVTLPDGTLSFPLQQQARLNNEIQLEQVIPITGGSIDFSTGLDRVFVFNDNENAWRRNWQSQPISIGFNQPLYAFNPLKWELKTQPLRRQIGMKNFVQQMESVASEAAQSYFNLLLADQNLAIAKLNKAVNDSIFQISKGRFNIGTIAENELLQTELAAMNAAASLNRSLIQKEQAMQSFRITVGLEDGQEIILESPREAPQIELDVQRAVSLAIQNNASFDQFKLNELNAMASLDQAKKSNTFRADLRASFGLNQQTSLGVQEVYDNLQNQSFMSVGMQIPILNWGKNRMEVKASKAQVESIRNEIELQVRLLNQDISQRMIQFNQLKEQLVIAEKSDIIAQKRYDVAKNRYLIGKVTVTDLQIAQTEKDSARVSYVRALQEFWSSYYQIRQLTLYDFEKDVPINYEVNIDL
jgi:outer membrane protein TolC